MKKIVFGIALAVLSLVITSGFNEDRTELRPGMSAPIINVENKAQSFSLNDWHGKYVLVTFWDSSDAQSRVANSSYQALLSDKNAAKVKFVGINFDDSQALFEEIVKADQLDAANQYRVEDDAARQLQQLYGLADGMGSVLISPDGRVECFNPTAEKLAQTAI